ncbi:MAG: alpha/beta fold hydrolase [Candidatus Eisenbacteria sp.]|nr:alpha/beta fold hydrolase [Candidatus Eisenbacteria bacterium]
MRVRILIVFTALAALLFGGCTGKHEPAPVIGIWQGSLTLMGVEYRIIFSVFQYGDGRLGGTMLRPDETDEELRITHMTFQDGRVRIEMGTINAVFDGYFRPDGMEMDGVWQDPRFRQRIVLQRLPGMPDLRKPQDPARPYTYDEEHLSFENLDAPARLAGTLTLPREAHPVPALVLISGGGPQNRDGLILGHRPFLVMADYLTRHGIAVLRFDDRGVGASTGDRSMATTEDYAGDALAGVAYLKTREEIDPARIGLLGHSEGGTIAHIAAAGSDDVAFIVMMASPGLPGDEYNIQFEESIGRVQGLTDEVIASKRAIQEQIFAILRETDPDSVLAGRLTEILVGLEPPLSVDRIQSTVDWYLHPWFRFSVTYDPAPVLRKVKCPVLALYGERDVQVPPERNAEAVEAALRAGRNKHRRVEVLPGLNHLFQTADTGAPSEYSRIQETLSPAVLELVGTWILEQSP